MKNPYSHNTNADVKTLIKQGVYLGDYKNGYLVKLRDKKETMVVAQIARECTNTPYPSDVVQIMKYKEEGKTKYLIVKALGKLQDQPNLF